MVLDEKGNGKIINTRSDHDYISYRRTRGVHPNDIVLTLCVYNPDTSFEDDIIERLDFVIDGGVEIGEEIG